MMDKKEIIKYKKIVITILFTTIFMGIILITGILWISKTPIIVKILATIILVIISSVIAIGILEEMEK